ncbi:MAG: class II aldolase/adducin family protein [Desulfurococcales archaeon]|nr:class II aldolase/adducin family protein [Desulfurococcales archaeon]
MADEDERLGKLLAALGDVMRSAHEKGLVEVFGGNASFRWGEGFYITPTQVPKHRLTPEDIVYVPFDLGPQLSLSGKKASGEWRMHQSIYLNNEEVRAVLFTRNPLTLALYSSGLKADMTMLKGSEVLGKCIAEVNSFPPGSKELAEAVGVAVKECRVVVILNQGVVFAAQSPYRALHMAETLEELSRITLLTNMLRGCRALTN